jgi:hypothetical protein
VTFRRIDAVNRYPPDPLGRVIVRLWFVHGCRHREIAELLGIHCGTVSKRIMRWLNPPESDREPGWQRVMPVTVGNGWQPIDDETRELVARVRRRKASAE